VEVHRARAVDREAGGDGVAEAHPLVEQDRVPGLDDFLVCGERPPRISLPRLAARPERLR
jgi:hypothetical protein